MSHSILCTSLVVKKRKERFQVFWRSLYAVSGLVTDRIEKNYFPVMEEILNIILKHTHLYEITKYVSLKYDSIVMYLKVCFYLKHTHIYEIANYVSLNMIVL